MMYLCFSGSMLYRVIGATFVITCDQEGGGPDRRLHWHFRHSACFLRRSKRI